MDSDLLFWCRSRAALQGGQFEVASLGVEGVAVRNSAKPDGPILTLPWDAWDIFLMGALRGDFDRRELTGLEPSKIKEGELGWRASS